MKLSQNKLWLVGIGVVLALPLLLLLLGTRPDASGSTTPDFFRVGSYYTFLLLEPDGWSPSIRIGDHRYLVDYDQFKVLEIGNDGWLLVELVIHRWPPDRPPVPPVWINTAHFLLVQELEKPNQAGADDPRAADAYLPRAIAELPAGAIPLTNPDDSIWFMTHP